MSSLANQLAATEREEVSRAVRILLARPLLTETSDPAGFALVRRRREPVARWFDHTCGWTLLVEPRRGYARLVKVRADPDGSRPARAARAGRAPFDRRRYVLLCVTAAELLTAPMTTVGMLADRVVRATAADPALPAFDPARRAERTAFVDVLGLLESYGVLHAVDGSTEAYAASPHATVLYRVDTTLLTRLPAAPVGAARPAVPPDEMPARFGDLLTGLVRERRHDGTDTGDGTADDEHAGTAAPDARHGRRLRHSVLRRLFDDPVLYRSDLTGEELAYVTSQAGRQTLRRSAEQAGFLLEDRAEGFLLVDPDALATDVRFPDDTSTARVAALLLLEPLCAEPAGLLPEQLAEAGTDLLRRFPRWARTYRPEEDGGARLSDDAVDVLCDMGLAHRAAGRTLARPAAHRYRMTGTTCPAPGTPESEKSAKTEEDEQ
ncbi:TIGR02678 family protein [Streptomyces scabiei]|uniref:TIGR02678 family protein n=1 Tax=Streptomyces scabiei TaxID=1930 RepID=UPI001B304F3A|nr:MULTISPECIES: TIGR02678 family protein [Streptomyces]MBP5912256.1 TIGR02678 family protein [Streptomyces sp. LBUM 1486]MDX2536495.1 TIGR02678 family protein [Streptomyces scabiei]MDX2799098.1 TIGR02678 family protein [Streptomyces scabiei]MDX3032588.1 TIGR02678 family protein [Streptomyces scabiei]MDX3211422.1 TIGR02678 family protein [Streptomyces scabiei]